MRALALTLITFSTVSLSFEQEMKVSLCDMSGLPSSSLARAKVETESVFSSAGVQILWRACDDGPDGSVRAAWFTLRLRSDKPPETAGPASLDAMGRAFLSNDGVGNLADAYIASIQSLAERNQSDAGVLLGHVIAHELGHLLLGPGHVPDGVMRPAWNVNELRAVRQRWLKFNQAERARIQQELNTRNAGPE